MFLDLSALTFFQVELFFAHSLLALLEVNRVNVINTNQSQQKHAHISRINPILLNQRVRIINQTSFIDRDAILRVFIFPNETHGL
jgi:hypothetical protein